MGHELGVFESILFSIVLQKLTNYSTNSNFSLVFTYGAFIFGIPFNLGLKDA